MDINDFSEAIFDTTVIVKGVIPPRRKKKDQLYEQQVKIHTLASSLLEKVEKGKLKLIIPSIALIETAAVVSRLTNDKKVSEEAVEFVRNITKKIVYDYEFLEKAILVGIDSKTSGFDVVFLTCSKIYNIPLITDDQRLYLIAKEKGYNIISLREISS